MSETRREQQGVAEIGGAIVELMLLIIELRSVTDPKLWLNTRLAKQAKEML